MTVKNSLTLLVLHKLLPCLLIGRIPFDCPKQCKQSTVVPCVVYLRFPIYSQASGTQDGVDADECIQLDMAEDILKILFEKDLKVAIESKFSRTPCSSCTEL